MARSVRVSVRKVIVVHGQTDRKSTHPGGAFGFLSPMVTIGWWLEYVEGCRKRVPLGYRRGGPGERRRSPVTGLGSGGVSSVESREDRRSGAELGGRPSPHWRSRGRSRQGAQRRGAG